MKYPVHEFLEKWYSAQDFGSKTNYGYHDGKDLNLKTGGDSDLGQELLAVADGEITSVHSHTKVPSFGKHLHLKVETPLGVRWFNYCHCQDILVPEGAIVKEGQLIAHLGKTGTTVAHLHLACKVQPTGVDAVATTQEELKSWEDPIAFIDKVNNYMESQKERYDIVYKGQVLATYETNPIDNIASLKAEIDTTNSLLENKTVEANTYRTELERQVEDNKDLSGQLNTARSERDDVKSELKEVQGWAKDLLGIDPCTAEQFRDAKSYLAALEGQVIDLTKEMENNQSEWKYKRLLGKYYLAIKNG